MFNNLRIKDNVVGFDTEGTGLVVYGDIKRWGHWPARPFAFSFCDTDGNKAYFRLEVDPFTRRVIPDKRVANELRPILANKKIKKVGHNIGYDIRMMKYSELGVRVEGPVDDTLIMAHVVTGGSRISYALKPLGVELLGVSKDDEEELEAATKKMRLKVKKLGWKIATKGGIFGKDPFKADYWIAPPKLCQRYAVRDAERTMLLWLLWYEEIMGSHLREVYQRERKILRVVSRVEDYGTRVFPEDIKDLRKFYGDYMKQMLAIANVNGGKGMNFSSPKQMVKKFIVEKKYKPLNITKAGNPQVNADFLKAKAEAGDRLAHAILEYRAGAQMLKAFLNPYDRFRVEESPGVWVLHPNYRQCGPITGRFSCGDPNLMQVASETSGRKRTEISLKPRAAFGPRPGYVWYLPDYKQVEVWVFSFLAKEPRMMETLMQGRDFHGGIAEQVWGKAKDYLKSKDYYRKRAKLLMFCKLYGGGIKKVAYLLDCEYSEAAEFVDAYDTELPGVKDFMKRMSNRAEREGFVINPFGRMYYIDPKYSYRATNYMVQGTSADIMKEAMIAVDKTLRARWKGCHLLLTLHDELVIEVPKKYHSKKLMREIIKCMQGDAHKRIGCPRPLPVSMKYTTTRWNKPKEIDL